MTSQTLDLCLGRSIRQARDEGNNERTMVKREQMKGRNAKSCNCISCKLESDSGVDGVVRALTETRSKVPQIG